MAIGNMIGPGPLSQPRPTGGFAGGMPPHGGHGSDTQTSPQAGATGGLGGLGSLLGPHSDSAVGTPTSSGMAAIMQQMNAASHADLSAQAQAYMNPSFEQAQSRLNESIQNPFPRGDINLNSNHQVVVLDGFMGGTAEKPAHGFGVADIVRQGTGLEREQIALVSDSVPSFGQPTPHSLLTAPGDAPASERVDAYIESMVAGGLSQTNTALEGIAKQDAPNLKGVNFSTSGSALTGFLAMSNAAIDHGSNGERKLTPEGQVLFEGLGLKENLTPENMRLFAERGTARFEQVKEESPLVQGQIERHEAVSKQLSDQGVHYTVSAGNDGGVIDQYRNLGVAMSDQADDNIYANEHNVTVGSLNTQGTATPTDDTVASHSVSDPEVDFLANGVDRKVSVFGKDHVVSGTSYSAPDINAKLVNLSNQNPQLSTSEVQNLLHNSAGPAIGGSNISAVR